MTVRKSGGGGVNKKSICKTSCRQGPQGQLSPLAIPEQTGTFFRTLTCKCAIVTSNLSSGMNSVQLKPLFNAFQRNEELGTGKNCKLEINK